MARKVIVADYVSLDGVIEDPVGMENSGLGNWTGPFSRGPEGDKFKRQELFACEAVLLGRVTYEGFAAVWPSVKDDTGFAERINSMPKFVASNTLQRAEWNNTTILSGDATDQSLVRDAIGQDKLQAWFARILAKKAVLMFDTCEAGSLTERKQTRGGLEQKASLGRLIQATGRATLTASTATQEAYEGHGGHGVFTFALLDALARADLNNNGLIELAELIQHVDGLVPAITEKRWGARQFPQMDAYGSNFPLARQVVALAPASDGAIVIPIKPTHVSTELLQIFREAGGTGAVVEQLPPFSTVTLVKVERGWMLIAKDGRALGYVAEAKLHKLN